MLTDFMKAETAVEQQGRVRAFFHEHFGNYGRCA